MSLADLMQPGALRGERPRTGPTVAGVATVAVASGQKRKNESPLPLTDAQQAAVDEAVAERAAIMQFDGGLDAKTAERIATTTARSYYNHLMLQDRDKCGCRTNLGALVARFCPEGQRLREAYIAAVDAREAMRPARHRPPGGFRR